MSDPLYIIVHKSWKNYVFFFIIKGHLFKTITRLLGECLLIYQVYLARLRERWLTSGGLPSDSTYVVKAEPGKLDIKRHSTSILFISLPS